MFLSAHFFPAFSRLMAADREAAAVGCDLMETEPGPTLTGVTPAHYFSQDFLSITCSAILLHKL